MKSSFEVLFGRVPSYENFCIFGCQVYPYFYDYADHKLSPQSIPCVFMGYHSKYKGYLCLDPVSTRVFVTPHAQFDEECFMFRDTHTNAPIGSLPLHTFLVDQLPPFQSLMTLSRPLQVPQDSLLLLLVLCAWSRIRQLSQ